MVEGINFSFFWLTLWIPFLIAVFILFFLIKFPRLASALATLGMFISFGLTLLALPQFYRLHHHHLLPLESSLTWISLGSIQIEFGILINGLTILMLLIVTGVGSLIFLYSMTYMEKDEGYARYFASLSLFAFSMIGIVVSNNFIQVFIFWELVGLSSYLLIGFWYQKPEASTAGKKAFLTTRVGDVGMMLGILTLFGFLLQSGLGTFNFLQTEQNLNDAAIPAGWMTLIALGIFLGVVGKSAQVPLHVWLPDAMEGPTPVSALIHAATMVAAGVFLLARVGFLFMHSPQALTIVAWTGAVTAFLAATVALTQNDIKKILAYSTLSQLGYMVMALGLRSSEAGMFHLTTHAFFKALLFLGAGSLIHAIHTQDIWVMGAASRGERTLLPLFRKMPITSLTFIIATLALMGIPPLSGYHSKEEILTVAHHGPTPIFWFAMVTVFLTAFYMGRLVTVVFFGSDKGRLPPALEHAVSHSPSIHESGWRMTFPLVILAIFSVIGGYLPIREMLPDRSHFEMAHGHALELISLAFALSGFFIAFLLYRFFPSGISPRFAAVRAPLFVLEKKYFFDAIYDFFIKNVQDNVARLSDAVERWVIVRGAVNGTAFFTRFLGDRLRKLQTGMVQFYALLFAGGFTLILFIWILGGRA